MTISYATLLQVLAQRHILTPHALGSYQVFTIFEKLDEFTEIGAFFQSFPFFAWNTHFRFCFRQHNHTLLLWNDDKV